MFLKTSIEGWKQNKIEKKMMQRTSSSKVKEKHQISEKC